MNYMDAACLIILFYYINKTKRRGSAFMIVSLLGKILSVSAAVLFCGSVTRVLRTTPLYTMIKDQAVNVLDIEGLLSLESIFDTGDEGIVGMLGEYVMANDNSEIYKLFGVNTFSNYIASYIANTIINIISISLIYFCVSVIVRAMLQFTGIFTRLPVIKQTHAVLNVIVGFLQGTVVIWLLMVALMFFVLQGKFTDMYAALLSSRFAVYFLEYNILAKIIFDVFG